MKSKIKYLFLLVLILILTSCTSYDKDFYQNVCGEGTFSTINEMEDYLGCIEAFENLCRETGGESSYFCGSSGMLTACNSETSGDYCNCDPQDWSFEEGCK